MLTHPTLDLLHELGLHGMAKGFKALEQAPDSKSLDHAEWLGLLLEHEVTLRRQKRFEARARTAQLRHNASIEDVDYRAARGLERALFLKLAGCDFIREHRNLLITGPCGVGKSWLACALGHKACREDFSVRYPACRACLQHLRSRAATAAMPSCCAPCPRRSPHPRRLGAGTAQCRAAPRPPGDRRGPLRRSLDHHHQPAAGRALVRDHRRANPC